MNADSSETMSGGGAGPPGGGEVAKAKGCRKALLRSYGLLLMAGSSCTFSVVSLLVSLLVTDFPVYQIVSIRFFMQWGCAALTLLVQRKSPCFDRRDLSPMVARSVFGIIRYAACPAMLLVVAVSLTVPRLPRCAFTLRALSYVSMVTFCTLRAGTVGCEWG